MATTTQSGALSSQKPSPTANTKPNRLPAPTLFIAPPSRNASNLSLSRQQPAEATLNLERDPISRHKSGLPRSRNAIDNAQQQQPISEDDSENSPHTQKSSVKKASERSLETRWKEMQNTLNEVELTAQSSTHVFGESHARALEDLRKAQVELARAWGRGNQDEKDTDPTKAQSIEKNMSDRFKGADSLAKDRVVAGRNRGDTDASVSTMASTALSDESAQSGPDVTSKSGRSQLEDETKQDIKLASERRAANEAYFRKVDGGVREVVQKLEIVAQAMRGVEAQSRSLWSDSSSDLATSSEEAGNKKDVKVEGGAANG